MFVLFPGQSSVEKMLSGKHYNNAVRTLKYVYKALFRLRLEAFDDWLLVNNKAQSLTRSRSGLKTHNYSIKKNLTRESNF